MNFHNSLVYSSLDNITIAILIMQLSLFSHGIKLGKRSDEDFPKKCGPACYLPEIVTAIHSNQKWCLKYQTLTYVFKLFRINKKTSKCYSYFDVKGFVSLIVSVSQVMIGSLDWIVFFKHLFGFLISSIPYSWHSYGFANTFFSR